MTEKMEIDDKEWTRRQVEEYRKRYHNYVLFAEVIEKILKKAAKNLAPLAIVQTRPKGISNFADKCQRKKETTKDPVNQFTDLCGGRIIVHTAEQVEAVSEFIEEHFEIDRENTIDVSQRLKPTEFGYRSVHYIVGFKKGAFPNEAVEVEVPPRLYDDKKFPNRRAEIQVRTILEHAWADVGHSLVYKSPFEVPAKWEREFAGVAAMLEGVDKTFLRIKEGLSAYASSYGAYMTESQMRDKIKSLEIVMEHDPDNPKLAGQIARLAMTLGEWQKAIDILSGHVDSGDPGALINLGVALCKKHKGRPQSRKYRQGQRYLERVCTPSSDDIEALVSLAGTYKKVDDEKARELYHRAFQLDPANPYPLENFLDLELYFAKDASLVLPLVPVIKRAVQRCHDQVEVGVNLPRVFYTIGKFNLLLGEPYDSLEAYAKAVQLSPAPYMVETALESLEKLQDIAGELTGYEWVRRLLVNALAVRTARRAEEALAEANAAADAEEKEVKVKKYKEKAREAKKTAKRVQEMALCLDQPIRTPVVIVAGGCDSSVEEQMKTYRQMTLSAFKYYEGTVVSGGTKEGISGLVGELGQKNPGTIRTIGYLPKLIPTDAHVDKRYGELYETDGSDFTPMEPLQSWIDIVASGCDPAEVKLLGINGGNIAAVEFRIALALGAAAGLIEDSGREAARLLRDEKWLDSDKLFHLPSDVMTVKAFIGSASPKLEVDIREKLAQKVHEAYRLTKQEIYRAEDPAMNEWDNLPEVFKESSAKQADDIFNKLREIGCSVRKVTDREIELIEFTDKEVELLAEIEHGRWNAERLAEGWSRGKEKDLAKKTSPHLASWAELPEEIREWDREAVRKIPEFLASINLEIRRNQ